MLQDSQVDCHFIRKETAEAELKASSFCRKCQKKFMDINFKGKRITGSVRVLGGNTTIQRCFTVEQSKVNADVVMQIREGN